MCRGKGLVYYYMPKCILHPAVFFLIPFQRVGKISDNVFFLNIALIFGDLKSIQNEYDQSFTLTVDISASLLSNQEIFFRALF